MKSVSRLERNQIAVATNGMTLGLTRWIAPFLIVLLTFTAFFPVLQNGFVDWDDDQNLLDNPNYRGLGWTQLRWMFTTFHMGHYQPLSWVTFGLDYLLWGMDPFGYHLTSLMLHAANAAVFYFVALHLLTSASSVPGKLGLRAAAGFAAMFFAIHPLRVESVAWATERRDVLSGLFFLATVFCYLRATTAMVADSARWRWMTAAVTIYGLSLFSKVSGVTLPIILLVLDVYLLRRLGGGLGKWFGPAVRRVWLEKVPFLLLALGAAVIGLVAQYQAGSIMPLNQYGLVPRVAQAFFGLAFYVWKTIIPVGLSPLYELPIHLKAWDWPFLLGGVVVLAVSIGLFIFRRRWPVGLVSWVCYVVMLAPLLGIAQNGPQIVADRYSYLSCLGWAILAGTGLLRCWRLGLSGLIHRQTIVVGVGLAAAVLVGLGGLTWKQVQVWHDSETLWRHVLAVAQNSNFKSSRAH